MALYEIIGRTKYKTTQKTNVTITKERYKQIRDSAWRFLLENKTKRLPINLELILKNLNIKLISYEEIKPYKIFINEINSLSAFTAQNVKTGKKGIFIDNNLPLTIQRFCIAHELAHIYLKHNDYKFKNLEQEANMFASRILMPISPLLELNIKSAEDISRICNVSIESAQFRFKRLQVLKKRAIFYGSPLEQKIKNNFKNFVKGI